MTTKGIRQRESSGLPVLQPPNRSNSEQVGNAKSKLPKLSNVSGKSELAEVGIYAGHEAFLGCLRLC